MNFWKGSIRQLTPTLHFPEWPPSLEIMCMNFILSGPRTSLPKFVHIHYKGSSHIIFSTPKSHILDSDGVWYSLFWSEWPKNHVNLKIRSQSLPPWDIKVCCTSNLEGRRHGTSGGATRTSRSHGTAPQGPRCSTLRGSMAFSNFLIFKCHAVWSLSRVDNLQE